MNSKRSEKRVLVTGGAGFVGMNICSGLLERGADTVLFDIKPPEEKYTGEMKGGHGKLTVYCGDILDTELLKRIIKEEEITDIIHAAAITPGAEMEAESGEMVIKVNCLGTASALKAYIDQKVPGRFLMLGSISAYGKTAFQKEPLIEGESMADPVSLYEISKFTAERIFLRYKELFHIAGCAVRIGDVFGPWEHYSGVRSHMSLPYQTTAMARKGKKACLSRNGRGEWIYGPELAEAVIRLLEAEELHYDVYPVSSGKRWTMSEWCAMLQKRFPQFSFCIAEEKETVNLKINQDSDNAPMALERLQEDTGYRPQYGLKEAFEDYMEWIARHHGYVV
ncbi:NAD(P)-dependent oxidoreductase [Clostridium sp. AM58-1XD]|uniref:NAD-dependent epimerase/dehydratase family protein n=1 Tax=Clostridium sp. AM58-1XD TaxID=2292307 RepID=UPI0015F562AC|nr:NAD(P)-dependent oxidoreductase [Clostridium sp. AM58-1XD]